MKDTDFSKLSQFIVFGKCFIPTSVDAIELFESAQSDFIESEFCLIPENELAISNLENSSVGQILTYYECTERDLKFHRCYMSLLGYIWDFMPDNFKKSIPKPKFYLFLKHLRHDYEVVYKFKDEAKKLEIQAYLTENKKKFRITKKVIAQISSELAKTELIEYESIAFGKMSEIRFKEYVRDQLPFIYSNVIELFYSGEKLNMVINSIEDEYKKFLAKLNAA